MTRIAIVAHFDSRGRAAPHFLRLLDQISEAVDRTIVASSSELSDDAIREIQDRAELFRRPNYGHDFGSWRDALERLDWASDADSLLLTNDSYVGFFQPLKEIVDQMDRRRLEFWGLTRTNRRGPHIQSYFSWFSRPVLRSRAFVNFWMDALPAPDRMWAIVNQEVGMTEALGRAGFLFDSYFQPTPAERARANARGVYWLYRRQKAFPALYDSLSEEYFAARQAWRLAAADNLNTSSAYADAVFDRGRLPVVKLDVLRNDPFWLGSGRLMRDLERARPDLMSGVREYVSQLAADYSPRRHENSAPARLGPLARTVVGYSARKGRLGGSLTANPTAGRDR